MEQHIQTTTFSKYRPEPCSLPRFCGKQTLGNTDLTTYHGARWERGLQFENSVKASGLSLRQSLWRHLHYEFDRRIRVIFLVISTEQDAKRSFTHTHTHYENGSNSRLLICTCIHSCLLLIQADTLQCSHGWEMIPPQVLYWDIYMAPLSA